MDYAPLNSLPGLDLYITWFKAVVKYFDADGLLGAGEEADFVSNFVWGCWMVFNYFDVLLFLSQGLD